MIGEVAPPLPAQLVPLSTDEIDAWRSLPAAQQPRWEDRWLVEKVRLELASLPPLVRWEEVRTLRRLLAEVVAGRMRVLQGGDCAEDPADCTPEQLSRRLGLLDAVAGMVRLRSRRPVIRVGRLAGQFAKPRTRPTETRDGVELPAFRGLLVNGFEFTAEHRRADPTRMLVCHQAAANAMAYLRRGQTWAPRPDSAVWTSHEALVLDYELPAVRRTADDQLVLTSTHWPWIGDRTRQLDGAHVRLLSAVSNPVACKVGPTATVDEVLGLCERLDPRREPGRLTLIARLGSGIVERLLPRLVAAVRAAGHPVIWLCDPMHGNTRPAADGRKTRLLRDIAAEVRAFLRVVAAASGVVGGLHLEMTPDPVTECLSELEPIGPDRRFTSLCDPRLNPDQAFAIASLWTE